LNGRGSVENAAQGIAHVSLHRMIDFPSGLFGCEPPFSSSEAHWLGGIESLPKGQTPAAVDA
jgi:hypothetical protein